MCTLELTPVGVGQLAERVLVAGARAGEGLLGHARILAPTLPFTRIRGNDVAAARNSPLSFSSGARLIKHTTDEERHDETRRDVPDPRRWWALALLCGAFFMVILDAHDRDSWRCRRSGRDLGFSEQGLQWVRERLRADLRAACSCSADGRPTCSGAGVCS